jgi:hypothetical protein
VSIATQVGQCTTQTFDGLREVEKGEAAAAT